MQGPVRLRDVNSRQPREAPSACPVGGAIANVPLAHARDVLADRRLFMLDAPTWSEFLSVLDRPVSPKPRLVELFADLGVHHLPVVDNTRHVLGMITQSDMIAALDRLHRQAAS